MLTVYEQFYLSYVRTYVPTASLAWPGYTDGYNNVCIKGGYGNITNRVELLAISNSNVCMKFLNASKLASFHLIYLSSGKY